jgi:hypothetical protein
MGVSVVFTAGVVLDKKYCIIIIIIISPISPLLELVLDNKYCK